eukprot:2264187-Pyramimonas_sp.AAC.1
MCQPAVGWTNITGNQVLQVRDGSIFSALWAGLGTRICGSELGDVAKLFHMYVMVLQRSAGGKMQY